MRRHHGRGIRVSRTAIIIGAVVVAVAGAAVASWRMIHHQATLPKATCGAATTHSLTGRTVVLAADRGALTCFAREARTCRPGSLRITDMGVDAGTDYVFSIEPGSSPCQVTEQHQDYSANFGGSQGPVIAASCRLTAVTRGGVTLRCGGQDVLLPAKVSAPGH
jgi:hypothetical protein